MLSAWPPAAALAADRRRLRRPGDRGAGGRRGRGARRWPVPPSSCPSWPGPAWSTPAGGAWWCCSTRWSRWSPGRRRRLAPLARVARDPGAAHARPGRPGPTEYAYEVQYLLDAPDDGGRRRSRSALAGLGDSLVVVGTGTSDGAGRHAGLERARPRQRRRRGHRGRRRGGPPVPDLGDPVRRPVRRAGRGAGAGRGRPGSGGGRGRRRPGRPVRGRGRGRGRRRADRNPSTAELLAAIRATGAGRVVLLPNDTNVHAVAVGRGRRGPGRGHPGRRRADPVAGAGAGRDRRARPEPAVPRRRDRDGRGGRRLPLRRGDDRGPGGADRGRAVRAGRRAGPGRGRGEPDRRRPRCGEPDRARPDAGRRRRAGHAAGRRGRAAGAGRGADRPRRAGGGRSPRSRCTRAASRTTRSWSASNDHIGHAARQGGRDRAEARQGPGGRVRHGHRARPRLPLPAPVRRAGRADRHRQPAPRRGGHHPGPGACAATCGT